MRTQFETIFGENCFWPTGANEWKYVRVSSRPADIEKKAKNNQKFFESWNELSNHQNNQYICNIRLNLNPQSSPSVHYTANLPQIE